jgi:8-oxo-dGTP diphosphatase
MNHKPLIVVSAVALLNKRNQILYAQRPKGKNMEGLWEFPGGKVEPGETAERALKRELMEELNIQVDVADLRPLTFASQEYDDFIMVMPLFICNQWSGDIHPNEGQNYAWVNVQDLRIYPMPPADEPLLDYIIKFMDVALKASSAFS